MIRLDTPGPGEFRVAVSASNAQKELGTGYFFAENLLQLQRGSAPILSNNEQKMLYLQFIVSIDKNNKRRSRRFLPFALCLLIPFFIMLVVGDATEGFDDNPIFLSGFVFSVILPFAVIPWIPGVQNAEREWLAELDIIHEEAIPKWTEQGYHVSRVEDKRCPKMIYFSFKKMMQEGSQEEEQEQEVGMAEEEFEAEMV